MMSDIITHHIASMQDDDGDTLSPAGRDRPVRRRNVPKIPTREEIEMSRMTYDGLLLQSQLCVGEERELSEIARTLFTREGEEVGKVALNRARSAMLNLVTMHHAKAVPNKKTMTHILSIASPGTQLAALMNINTRRAEQGRQEDRRSTSGDAEKVVIADLPGVVHSIM
jgi:hypothetical protein